MDTRLIFRDYLDSIKTDAGTQRVSLWSAMVSNQGEAEVGKGKSARLVCQENPLRRVEYPYHKPTQVDEMSILRRSGDGLFRN